MPQNPGSASVSSDKLPGASRARPMVVVAIIVLLLVVVGVGVAQHGAHVKTIDGSWQDITNTASWTFQKGDLHAVQDNGATCDGTYTPDGRLLRIVFHCTDENSSDPYVGRINLSADKNVGGVAEDQGDDWAPCLVRVGTREASVDSSTVSTACASLAESASNTPKGSASAVNDAGATPTIADSPDAATQLDLKTALVVEETVYTDNQTYDPKIDDLAAVEPSLPWSTITIAVGDAVQPGDNRTVCMSEASPSGAVFEVADVATGSNTGTYRGKVAGGCPGSDLGGAALVALGHSW